jgi:uncharacterized protein (TIGR02996 family)
MSQEFQSEEDRAFIRAILSAPGDVAPRLIYADWLDEQNTDPALNAAKFLRLLAKLSETPARSPRTLLVKNALRRLQKQLPQKWIVTLDVALIENCVGQFEFVCPKKWEQLRTTDEVHIRYCDQCHQNVYYSLTLAEATKHAVDGRCVALPTGNLRRDGDLETEVRKRLDERNGWANGELLTLGRINVAQPRTQDEE